MQEYPANGFCLFLEKETFKTRVPQSSPANCLKKKEKTHLNIKNTSINIINVSTRLAENKKNGTEKI